MVNFLNKDTFWMHHALRLAQQAIVHNEIPVGALVVQGETCIAEGWNQPITTCDPTAHAEIIALRKAAQQINNYRLTQATLYVTLEPCTMCAGALLQARIQRVVFGAYDPKSGAAGSRFDVLRDTRHNHTVECIGGVLIQECGKLLQDFFIQRRKFSTAVKN